MEPDVVIINLNLNKIGYIEIVPVDKGIKHSFTNSGKRIIPDILPLYLLNLIANADILPDNAHGFIKLPEKVSYSPFIIDNGYIIL